MGQQACCSRDGTPTQKPVEASAVSSRSEEDSPLVGNSDTLGVAQELEPQKNNKGSGRCCCCCCCCLVVLVLVLAAILWGVGPWYVGTQVAYDKFLKPNSSLLFEYTQEGLDPTTLPNHIWWPGCTQIGNKSTTYLNSCASPCFSSSLIPAVTAFNTQHTFKLVTYPSRPDKSGKTVNLTGWMLPGDDNHNGYVSPRIVIQHGYTANSNKWSLTLIAYYLRSMGFDVLINNLRDHGYSTNVSDITTWGYVYHYDLLGAWDYLRLDPDGILSGEIIPAKVGVAGFSMGAFVALNAFTLEHQIPALWADSPPSSPKVALGNAMKKTAGIAGFIAKKIPYFIDLTWFWIKSKAPVDLDARSPLKDIPIAPDGARDMQIIMNKPDTTVPMSGVEDIVKLARKYPRKYNLSEPYYTDAVCNKEDHIVSELLQPTTYRARLCKFWTSAFDISESFCGLNKLPYFPMNATTSSARKLIASAKDIDVDSVIV